MLGPQVCRAQFNVLQLGQLLVNIVQQTEGYVKCLNEQVVTESKDICLLEEVIFAYAVSFLERQEFCLPGEWVGWERGCLGFPRKAVCSLAFFCPQYISQRLTLGS